MSSDVPPLWPGAWRLQVQDAIEHNKRVFQKRVEQEDLMIKKKAFNGWRAARYGTLAKQQVRVIQTPKPISPTGCPSPNPK